MQKDENNDGLKRVWPEPSVDSDKNMGYALQWFGFAAIAAIAWLGFAWRIWRRKKNT
jgi:cytochrome oxidase assembly protein ShyY1